MTDRRVLVVDDDDDVREITMFTLEAIGGWQVLDADRGAVAVEIARTHRPDLVLLDVMMPDMDGHATFRALQADPLTRDIPVILLTAKVEVAHTRNADDGLAGVISKPFDPRGLVADIDRLLAAASTRRRSLERSGARPSQRFASR